MSRADSLPSSLVRWLDSDDTGLSSTFMVRVIFQLPGAKFAPVDWPWDEYDFGRCVRLLDAVPEAREHLHELAAHGPVWAALVREWASLERMYRANEWRELRAALQRCEKGGQS